jgi:ElaB/YqjD/DUF883 family membrane-anchored ribosome-binding protein
MEVYFKNLSAEETPTERLVEDVMALVSEAEDLVNLRSGNLEEGEKQELQTALERIKAQCAKVKEQAMAGARQADQLIRRHPYASLGVVFGAGILVGWLLKGKPGARELRDTPG